MKKHFRIPMQFFAKEEKPEEKASETEEEKKSEAPAEEKKEESEKEEMASDEKQADENGEGANALPEKKTEEKSEEGKSPEAPKLSETDELKAENLRLKTQLEAMKIGFAPNCLEDAVVLAENIVRRDGTDISEALQAVAKKYPEWKSDGKESKSKGGFKVGADSPKDKTADEEQLNSAFGIRKKK